MLNLKRLFGDYRVRDSRLQCHFGVIVPFGEDQLMAIADDPRVIKRLSKSPYASVDFDDDSFVFDLDDFDSVAEIMRPVRRD